MFKKLRIKFIAITMVMVAAVMALAFTAVCISEYQRTNAVVQTALSDAIDAAVSDSAHDRRAKRYDVSTPPDKPAGLHAQDGVEGGSSEAEENSLSASEASSALPVASAGNDESASALSGALGVERAYAASGDEAGSFDSNEPNREQGNPETSMQDDQYHQRGSGSYQDMQQQGGYQGGQGQASPEAQYLQDADSGSEQPSVQERESASGEARQSGDSDGYGSANDVQDQGAREYAEDAPGDERAMGITLDEEDLDATAPPMIGNRDGGGRSSSSLVPVAVYTMSDNGTLRVVPQVTSATISEEVLKQAAQRAAESDDGYATYDDLDLNVLKRVEGNTTYLGFADTSYTKSWMDLAFVLVMAGLATMVLFFVVCLFYSRWALGPVREAWDSQRQFVADASHDLKTPLTVILANASILLKHPEHTIASESQWVESTQKEAEDMQGLVNEMLELAQVEAGETIEVERSKVDFSDLVDGETLVFDSIALERSCAFMCSVAEGVFVLGNEKQLKKMSSTLIENAFKYVDEGGSIEVNLKGAAKEAELSIRNTGSVISPDDTPHIFDRFYRTDKARTSGAGGFGLGLAIAREIALQHGGDITCESSSESGTVFTVKIPLMKDAR